MSQAWSIVTFVRRDLTILQVLELIDIADKFGEDPDVEKVDRHV